MAKKKKGDEDLAFAAERTFLAQEFLTWLWFRCEVEGGELDLDSGHVSVVVEEGLQLASWEEEGKKAAIRGGMPTTRPEAASALGAGLLLKRAKLIIAKADGREWLCTLDGDSLDLLSVKVPERPEGEEPEEGADVLAEKLALGEELRDTVDALYRHFLGLRLGSDWKKIEVPRMTDWVRSKLEGAWSELVTA